MSGTQNFPDEKNRRKKKFPANLYFFQKTNCRIFSTKCKNNFPKPARLISEKPLEMPVTLQGLTKLLKMLKKVVGRNTN